MTLITYLSRVHFADGVLEVALSSELELNKLSRPLLLYEQHVVNIDFYERVAAGLPFWCDFDFHEIPTNINTQLATTYLQQRILDLGSDVIIAFGSSLALLMADTCCRRLDAKNQDNTKNSSVQSPKFFAIPGVDGVPSMSMRRNDGVRTIIQGEGIQPSTVILDPTLIIGESVERTSNAIAETLARCLSIHFSDGFNPPAEGIALEGAKRILRNLRPMICEDSLEMRRELMAASLNGALAMQKESGISHEMGKILLNNPPRPVNKGALMRLLILFEAELLERSWTLYRRQEVRLGLGVPAGIELHDWLSSILKTLPLPESLSTLGFELTHIIHAAEEFLTRQELAFSAKDLGGMLYGINLGRSDLLTVPES